MNKLHLAVAAAMFALTMPAGAQDFPAGGRTIMMIVPSTAGGGTDVAARLVAPVMEKDLGVPVEVVNKPGASMQIGVTEALRAKPDGYTLFWSVLPTQLSIYLDPERQAAFTRADIQPIANVYYSPNAIWVLANSPYKSIHDLVAAAKASPKAVKSGTTGFMSTGHFANIEFQRKVGVEMATVNFQGGGPQVTALLGGHIDVGFNSIGELLGHHRAGTIRILALMADERDSRIPDVPTLKDEGIDAKPIAPWVGLSASAAVPKDIIAKIRESLRKALENPDVVEKMTSNGNTVLYMDTPKYEVFWDQFAEDLKSLIALAKEQAK